MARTIRAQRLRRKLIRALYKLCLKLAFFSSSIGNKYSEITAIELVIFGVQENVVVKRQTLFVTKLCIMMKYKGNCTTLPFILHSAVVCDTCSPQDEDNFFFYV